MKDITTHLALIACGCAFSLGGCDARDSTGDAQSSDSTSVRDTQTTPADNTANNRDVLERDARTPLDQSESSEHIQLTADIRRAIIADDTLSLDAKNCKIITDTSGRVWLRGVVNSQAEKDLIERLAVERVSADMVTNELSIK